MPFVVLTTPSARRDIRQLRGKPAARYVQAVKALRAQGCKAGHYRLTAYHKPWICCIHLYADWRLLARFGNDDRIHILAVGRHRRGHNEDIYRWLIELSGIKPPDKGAKRTKPPCCGKPTDIVDDPGEVEEYLKTTEEVFDLDGFLSGDKEVEERIKRARPK